MNVIRTSGLGKRYKRQWALRDCNLAIPAGRVVALVGPNGAGKTTLLHLAVGLITPSIGDVEVLDGEAAGSPAALDAVAFVAQDAPLYKNLSVADGLHLARNLNGGWDQAFAQSRLDELGIAQQKKIGTLSGGQQSQLALTLALARRPQLLVLDEPLAMLDPLARHEFMAAVMAAVADSDLSVVLSSHALAELERVADYLILLSKGRVQVAGGVDDLLARHRILTVPAADAEECARRFSVVHTAHARAQVRMLVRVNGPSALVPEGWETGSVGLEEVVLAYLREPTASALPGPEPADERAHMGRSA